MALSKIDSDGIVSGGITADSLNVGQIGGRRNLIINGAMQVAQRGTSLSLAHDGTTNGYVADRFQFVITGTADSLDGTLAQVSDAPDGYSNSLKWTTGTAESTAADEAVYLQHKIEAQNLQHLGYGNSTASSITASFWVKSSQTGVFAVSMYVPDGPRNIGTTYTINAANTWEQKTITFVGDTGGTINNDNGIGIQFVWHLAAGSNFNSLDNTSWGAYAGGRWGYGHVQNGVTETASATWQITGVQLEVGSVATPFEHRSYGEELALCQRYYQQVGRSNADEGAIVGMIRNTHFTSGFHFPVTMRSSPTGVAYGSNSTSGTIQVSYGSGSDTSHAANSSDVKVEFLSLNGGRLRVLSTSGTNGDGAYVDLGTGTNQVGLTFDAEL